MVSLFTAPNITTQTGDITTLHYNIPIVHQCNLFSTYGAGLASIIHDKFPYSNLYEENRGRARDFDPISDYGTLRIDEPSTPGDGPIVVSFLSQYRPGSCDDPEEHTMDNPIARLGAFALCLQELEKWINDNNVVRVAFPARIGCGIAGGDWRSYSWLIDTFAYRVPNCEVLIVSLPSRPHQQQSSSSELSSQSSSDLDD